MRILLIALMTTFLFSSCAIHVYHHNSKKCCKSKQYKKCGDCKEKKNCGDCTKSKNCNDCKGKSDCSSSSKKSDCSSGQCPLEKRKS